MFWILGHDLSHFKVPFGSTSPTTTAALLLLLATIPFIRLFNLSVILNVDLELSSSFCGEELIEDVDERLGDNANTEVIVGVIVIVNITIVIFNMHNDISYLFRNKRVKI